MTFRNFLFTGLLGILWLPLVEKKLHPLVIRHLDGAITHVPNTVFTMKGWFSGKYQPAKENYLNDKFGFRNVFIRINNELNYRLFNKVYAQGVVVGKKGCLYEENYIKTYNGEDFIGKDSITSQMEKIRFIQDTLEKLNKTLLVVFAASKGSYYPEYFPDNMTAKKGPTNYEYYLKLASGLGINYIDFDKYFVDNKLKSKYPLFPKHGIHWSLYGECVVADSITRYIEKARKINMPHIYWNKVDMHYPKPGMDDIDVENGMNLLFPLKEDELGYPELQFEKDSGKIKPSLIVISDSFYWGMYNFGIWRLFSKNKFWYYNNEIFPDTYQKPTFTKDINLKEQIAGHDVIILMASAPNLKNFGWGFIEKTYSLFYPNNPVKTRVTDRKNNWITPSI